jgi:GNAT superfamily N-acetyltransferase
MSIDLDYLVRLARADDIALLPSVERRAVRLFDDWLSATGLTAEVLEDVSSIEEFEEARARGHLWVAVSEAHDVVGFAQVVILDGLAHLDEIDVVPECGRRGIGSRLVEAVCEWAARSGYEKVTLSTFRDVPFNAPFYARLGFTVVDPAALPPEHAQLVHNEHARGLRTELRVIMERRARRPLHASHL